MPPAVVAAPADGLQLVLGIGRRDRDAIEAQEVNWLLRSIVKQPSAPDLEPGDILRPRRAIFPAGVQRSD